MFIGFVGTGKIFFVKVIVREVSVFFIIVNGLEFLELFVGVGLARVGGCCLFLSRIVYVLCGVLAIGIEFVIGV